MTAYFSRNFKLLTMDRLKAAYDRDFSNLMTKWQRYPEDQDQEEEMERDFQELEEYYAKLKIKQQQLDQEEKEKEKEKPAADKYVHLSRYNHLGHMYAALNRDLNLKKAQYAKHVNMLVNNINDQYKAMQGWQMMCKDMAREAQGLLKQKSDTIEALTKTVEDLKVRVLELQQENMTLKASGMLYTMHITNNSTMQE